MQYLDPVVTTVSIAGKQCHFVHLTLRQVFNDHHSFQIKVDYEELDKLWMENPIKMIRMIGEIVTITMEHRNTKASNLFSGVITDVSMSGRHGQQNYIIITGASPTIRLSGTPTMDSFVDLNLKTIVQEVVGNSGNGGEVNTKPVHQGPIDYLCQYQETAFDFINRLSWLYGEWFFYDGTTTHFGKPSTDPIETITYDEDMTYFDLNAHMIPQKMNRFEYIHHDINEANSEAPKTIAGVRGYIKVAMDQSDKIYTSKASMPLKPSVRSKKILDDMVKVDKYRSVSQLLIMKGSTHTCRVRIGKEILVKLPKQMEVTLKEVEKFIVTEVVHEIDQDGTYSNTFSGIPNEMENIPMKPIPTPIAQPQVAWVKSNADEKGRIRVQLQWQKYINKETNWIRVQTPDAGKSDDVKKNRGFVFIPEEGDLVMVGYENGDPNRPYVAGSVFPENESLGCGPSNYVKTIITRSGHTIRMDDTKGEEKIQVHDKKGNLVEINTVSDTININANATINMTAVDVNIMAKRSFNVTAGMSIAMQSGVSSSFTTGGSSILSSAKDTQFRAGKTLSATGGKDASILSGSGASIKLNAKGNADLQAKKKVTVLSNNNVELNGKKKIMMTGKEAFMQGNTKAVIKGSKIKNN